MSITHQRSKPTIITTYPPPPPSSKGTIENPGVNRRAISELLSLVQQRQEDTEYQLSVSLMEIYNENVYDLLDSTRKKLSIHHDQDGVYVDGLKQESVDSTEALERVMALGDEHRSVSATKMNIHSSRSHMLMQVYVNGYNKISKVTTAGKLTLVDLAGSERVSKSEASGARLVEAAAINKSLSALGQVFKCLATNAPHIPYRNSKLTHVLQDSLGWFGEGEGGGGRSKCIGCDVCNYMLDSELR